MKRILVVDDHKNLLKLYKMELEEEGYVVDILSNYERVPSAIENHQYDLLVIEIMRSQIANSLHELSWLGNRLPVIINTTHMESLPIQPAPEAWVEKSSDLSELKKSVKNTLK